MNTLSDNPTGPDDELRQQAWVWLRQLNSGDVKTWDAQAFERWLGQSPAHKAAFHEARQRWNVITQAGVELLRTDVQIGASHARAMHGKRRSVVARRAFLGTALGGAVAASVVALAPAGILPSPDTWRADDSTAAGEQRTLAFGQRVQVTLNTRTSIRRQDGGVALISGEAAIDLSHGARPFEVVAGVGRSAGASGRFEVSNLDHKVCVTCLEGTVRVEHPAGQRTLLANQQTAYDARAIGGIAVIEPQVVSAWRRGELVFNETRLKSVLAEIDRYRPGHIVLMNDSVANKPVSGVFSIASLDVALMQLCQTFSLTGRSLPGGLYLVS